MKKLLWLMLFCALFSSCKKEMKQVDPTKKERTAAYYELQALLERPNSEFRDSLLRVGDIKDTTANMHYWRIVQAFKVMSENNCFELFKKKNDDIALACKALAEAPEPMWGKVMLTLPGEGFISPGPLMIREIQNAKLSRLRTKVIEKKLLTAHEVYTTPSEYMRFVLFLDGQVKPMYRNDSFYLLLRQMLLDSRPDQKRGAFGLLDITVLNDTIVIDGEKIGTLRKLNQQNPDVEERFNRQVTEYRERKERPQRTRSKNDEPEIAPDFYAKKKPIEEESAHGDFYSKKNKKKQTIVKETQAPQAPPLPRHVASITVDKKISVPELYSIIEAVSAHKINEFSLYADSHTGAHFRTVAPEADKKNQIVVDTVERHYSNLILRGVSENGRHNLVYLSMSTSLTNVVDVITKASQKRFALLQFERSRAFYRRKRNSTLLVDATPILSTKDIKAKGVLPDILSGSRPGSATPAQNGLRGLTGENSQTNKARNNRISKKSSSSLTGNRSRANVMRTVRNNMASLKYAFNRRLRAKPGLRAQRENSS